MLLNFYIHTIDCILESFMIKPSFASSDGVSVGMDVLSCFAAYVEWCWRLWSKRDYSYTLEIVEYISDCFNSMNLIVFLYVHVVRRFSLIYHLLNLKKL